MFWPKVSCRKFSFWSKIILSKNLDFKWFLRNFHAVFWPWVTKNSWEKLFEQNPFKIYVKYSNLYLIEVIFQTKRAKKYYKITEKCLFSRSYALSVCLPYFYASNRAEKMKRHEQKEIKKNSFFCRQNLDFYSCPKLGLFTKI